MLNNHLHLVGHAKLLELADRFETGVNDGKVRPIAISRASMHR